MASKAVARRSAVAGPRQAVRVAAAGVTSSCVAALAPNTAPTMACEVPTPDPARFAERESVLYLHVHCTYIPTYSSKHL